MNFRDIFDHKRPYLVSTHSVTRCYIFKGLITVGRELRQQHPSDLLSGAGTSRERSKSLGCCCHNSRPTVINPDYNMTKQLCMKRIYDKIRSKCPPNRAPSPTCLHYDVTHHSLTTGIVALHIPSWRVRERKGRRQACKTVWPVNAGRVICRYRNHLYGITNHHKDFWDSFFGNLSHRFKQNHKITISALAPRRRLTRALHCDARDCLTPGAVALHIPPSGATTTVSRQISTQSCYNTLHNRCVGSSGDLTGTKVPRGEAFQ